MDSIPKSIVETKVKGSLQAAFNHLEQVMLWRAEHTNVSLAEGPAYHTNLFLETSLGRFLNVDQLACSQEELLTVLMAIAPHLYARLIGEVSVKSNNAIFYSYSEIRADGVNADPTGETLQFLLYGTNFEKSITLFQLLETSEIVKKAGVYLAATSSGEPKLRGKLLIYEEELHSILYYKPYIPKFSEEFPAQRITTKMQWDDLILPEETLTNIHKIKIWLKHNHTLMHELNMKHKVKPGFRSLFHGPPGTGKTLAASLLGNETNKEVFRVDLSLLVSKYIGETEKHLGNLFDKARHKEWILFFDEADAIFGKRTNVKDAHDKYANQEVSYLLQKMEAFPGVIILASNYKDNIDDAFMRRFQSVVKFEFPKPKERYQIWKRNIPFKLTLASDVDLMEIAGKYILNGSNIMNSIQDASLYALENGDWTITKAMLIQSIEKEYQKEDREL